MSASVVKFEKCVDIIVTMKYSVLSNFTYTQIARKSMTRRATVLAHRTERSASDKSSQLSQEIYECLLSEIIAGVMAPGQYLSEVNLSQRFEASRTQVREALIHLHKEALLEKGPFKGYVVVEMSLESIRELFQLRLLLEPAAAKLAARNSKADRTLKKIQALQERMQEAVVASKGYQQFLQISELDCGFHKAIGEACGNRRLAQLIMEIMNQLRRFQCGFKNRPWLSATIEEHTTILDAIKLRDPPKAEQFMLHHIQQSIARIKELSFGPLHNLDSLQGALGMKDLIL